MIHKTSDDNERTPTNQLPFGSIVNVPGTNAAFKKGDKVYVMLENGNPADPRIIGFVKKDSSILSEVDARLTDLVVTQSTKLTDDILLGVVYDAEKKTYVKDKDKTITWKELKHLKGLDSDISGAIQKLNKHVEDTSKHVTDKGSLNNISSIRLVEDKMYGTSLPSASNYDEGSLFFLIEE